MRRIWEYKGVRFKIANYTPRKNNYENGLRFALFVGPEGEERDTGMRGLTMHACKDWATKQIDCGRWR